MRPDTYAGAAGDAHRGQRRRAARTGTLVVLAGILIPGAPALAEIDGHGPDAWQVTGVAPDDVLNARTGPGTEYPVIESFAPDERGMEQITCVPFYTPAFFMDLSDTDIADLPPRWCLMRSADLRRAGWVAERHIREDSAYGAETAGTAPAGDNLITEARALVQAAYEAADRAPYGEPHPLDPAHAGAYFSTDVVEALKASPPGADPLYGAQDFQGSRSKPVPDPDQPMLRGMITLHMDIVNFGQPQRVTFRLRPDTALPGSPVRIFRIDHDGWSFPQTPSD